MIVKVTLDRKTGKVISEERTEAPIQNKRRYENLAEIFYDGYMKFVEESKADNKRDGQTI